MKLLMYGAGSIGRGFIGPLFAQSGYEVVFVDVDMRIVEELNRRGEYALQIIADPPYASPVHSVRAIDGRDEQAVMAEIASCDIMATSLGAAVLERVAPLIARGLLERVRTTGRPLDILICENLKNAPQRLRQWLKASLPEQQHNILQKCGLIETAIGRMVPVANGADKSGDLLSVAVEEYDFLPVDADAFVGEIPTLDRMVAYSPFAFYEERKLYMHNMGHAVCAYLGLLQGYSYIYEAISDPYIRLFVQSAMTESAAMLSIRHHTPFAQIFSHAEDLLHRFGNRALGDTCERVARDPMRKLADDDRFAGPLRDCWESGIYPVYIASGLAAALLHLTSEKAQAKQTLNEVCQLNSEQSALVMELYGKLLAGCDLPTLLQTVQESKRRLYGELV